MNPKVLVVGTTSDYIQWIRQKNPDRCLFLTTPEIRRQTQEETPDPHEELLLSLDNDDTVREALAYHLRQHQCVLSGVVAFDCESLRLASLLAWDYGLPFPSEEAIILSRDKYLSKSFWSRKGLSCPRARMVQSPEGVFDFLEEIDRPCVLKPLCGSGSELVFHCASRRDCQKGAQQIQQGLLARKGQRLYQHATDVFLAEECILGTEYSCDFSIRNGKTRILRLTRKIKQDAKPFGTISGYLTVDRNCAPLGSLPLEAIFSQGAEALGLDQAICMVDFMIQEQDVILLEMTPRPGGDCLPSLLQHALSLDILTYALDFAEQKEEQSPPLLLRQCAALRLHAGKSGLIKCIDDQLLREDQRILDIQLVKKTGDRVVLPPHDYDSWYLGHVVFAPHPDHDVESQARELRKKMIVELVQDDRE